ncbi:MAG TPA: CBS domain-containing protein [Candidatus Saccharimonadales bacterium]|nr:CBS domain-containing protein [Candidatus Saccharimonadales bacterium]
MATNEWYVRDVMTSPVISVEPSTLLLDAALLLRGSSIRHLPVLEGPQLVGILSERDIQRCAPSRLIPVTEDVYNAVFANTKVERVMTREPKSTTSLTPLLGAMAAMQQGRYGCMPVVDDGRVVGILTRSDLMEALQRVLTTGSVAK